MLNQTTDNESSASQGLALVGGGAARFRHPPLEPDGVDRGVNVELRWNFESFPTSPVRVVLFLHGWASRAQSEQLARRRAAGQSQLGFQEFLASKAAASGLRFTDATGTAHGKFPVLAIVPRGMPDASPTRFSFGHLMPQAQTKVRDLAEACLRELVAQQFPVRNLAGQLIRYEQLIVMAHAASGDAVAALLDDGLDPDGVALLDASTSAVSMPVRVWLRTRARRDPKLSVTWLRVLVSKDSLCANVPDAQRRPVLQPRMEKAAREIALSLPPPPHASRRVEHTTMQHQRVDGAYACPLALDMSANLDGMHRQQVAPLLPMRTLCEVLPAQLPPLPPQPPPAGGPNAGTAPDAGAREHGLPYAEAASSPHPLHVVTGDAASGLFNEERDVSLDQHLDTLGELFGFPTLLRRGMVIGSPAAAATVFRMRLRGRLVVPRDLAGRANPVPIVFVLMGNHRAFDPSTAVEVENFNGYDYLQQHLADLGVASCSVDTNLANALGLGIRSRAEMLLATMSMVRSSAPAAIRPKLDFTKAGLIGHSRGGEAVALAALLASARGLPFTIRCVGAIAPTDFSLFRAGGSIDGSVPVPMRLAGSLRLLVLYGSHDGDVGDPIGNGFGLYDRARCDKTLVYARGLTHNRFNSVWNECADYADGRHAFVDDFTCRTRAEPFDQRVFAAVVHREYAKFFMGALVRRTLLADATAEDVLRGLVAPTRAQLRQSAGLPGPAASLQWSVRSALAVDEFDSPGVGPRTLSGGSVALAFDDVTRSSVPHVTNAFVASASGQRVRVDIPSANRNLSARRELTFRLTSMIPTTSEAAIAGAALPDWEIRVVSSRGTAAARPAQLDQRGLRPPNRPFFNQLSLGQGGNVTKNQFDTLSIPLGSFRNVDWNDVRAVEFEARGGAFPLIMDSIAFV
jgi:hypothetical protein